MFQMFGSREAELREEVAWLQQEKQELQHSISLLEVDNQALRDQIQPLRGEKAPEQLTLGAALA